MAKNKNNKNTKKKAKKKKISFGQVLALVLLAVLTAAYFVGLKHEETIDKALGLVEIETFEAGDVETVGRLTVHFLDVGNADACLVELPDDKLMLIDGGESDTKTKNKFDSYISDLSSAREANERGAIERFDYGIITHSHEDHIGSMDYVLERYPFSTFYRPNEESTREGFSDPALNKSGKNGFWGDRRGSQASIIYKDVISAIYTYSDEIIVTNPADDSQNKIAPDLSPSHEEYYEINFYGHQNSYYSKTNNFSPIIIISYQDRRIALSGDAETIAENEFAALAAQGQGRYSIFKDAFNKDAFNVDVIKLGHHGSDTSNSQIFLETLVSNQSYRQNVLIFVPTDGKAYGHPSETVLTRLIDMGFKSENIYRADINGDIAIDFLLYDGQENAVCSIGGLTLQRAIYKYSIGPIEVCYKTIGLGIIIILALVLVPTTFLSTKNKNKIIKSAKKSAKNIKK